MTQAGRTAVMSEPLRFELKPAGSFYVSANMARMAAGILRQRSTLEPRLTRTLVQMLRQLHAEGRPSLPWYAEDIDAVLGQAVQERKRRLPSVAGLLRFQHVVLAQRVRQWQAGYRGRRCRDHYQQALRRVAVEVSMAIPEVQIVQDTALHKWVQHGMKTARFWSHAPGDGQL